MIRIPSILSLLTVAFAAGGAFASRVAVFTRPAVAEVYDGPWMVELAVHGEVESRVFDADGECVAGPFAAKVFSVPEVKPWSAEDPVCYTLVTEADGERTETVFGFAERVIRAGRLCVNGRPVRLKLGPKRVNGNTVAAIDCLPEVAWTNGLYRVPLAHLARLPVMKPLGTSGATRHAFQDWSVKATNRCERIVVANRNSFLDASDVTLRWMLLVDGEPEADGTIDLLKLKPGREASFDMPAEVTAARFHPGTVSVRFQFERGGETIAEDQVDLVASRETAPLSPDRPWWSFGSKSVAYEEKREASGGVLRHFTAGPVRFTFDENRLGAVTFARCGLLGERPLVRTVLPVREGPSPEFFTDLLRPPSPVDARRGSLTFTAMSEGDDLHCAARWTVYPNGVVACQAKLRAPKGGAGERLGFALSLPYEDPTPDWTALWLNDPKPGADVRVDWFGLGPWSTLPGVTEGAFLGRWETTLAEGPLLAESVRGLRIGELTVRTLGAPLAVKVRPDFLELFGEPDEDGVVELAFTLSAGDSELTARAPEAPADLPLLPTVDNTLKGSESK